MSTLILELRNVEAEIKSLQEKKERLEADPRLAKDIELRDLVAAALAEYERTPQYLLEMFGVGGISKSSTKGSGEVKQRRERIVKRYLNPHTQEVIETKGGNHKGLNEWKNTHGKAEVETWVQDAA
ncbi:histone-like nucleoid-structuring protein, MvaT/MvaU family [Pseudomonas syringae pv. actinidiae]|nr:histone-like nucleoid-structuring protein, MvaT/MvaU family [Pseudomonas syringae pv. actinidiae]